MTAIPDGGHEVQWGVRLTACGVPRVENYSRRYMPGRDQEAARAAVAFLRSGPDQEYALVAREVTYGPWVSVEIEATP